MYQLEISLPSNYLDVIHETCGSPFNFYFFSLDFYSSGGQDEGMIKLLHLSIYDFSVSCGQKQFSCFSEIYLVHEKKRISWQSLRKTI